MPPKTVTRRRILTRRPISRPPETSLRNLIGQPSQQRNYEPTLVSRPEPPAVSQAQQSEAPHPAMMGFDGHIDGRRIPDAGVPTEIITGVLDIIPEGHGVIRPKFSPSDLDAYISSSQIRRFYLRRGDIITGPARRPKENERYWGLLRVDKVFDQLPEIAVKRVKFESLTPIFPDRLMKLETDPEVYSTRLIDIVAPVGFGQRGLIVSPPKAGKTTILKDIATGIAKNHPDVHLMAVLVGERPEEVTDIRRHIEKMTGGIGEVAASNFDEPPEEQTRLAEIALERAKRLIEQGRDVAILLDSITRLARAYNLAMPTSGRTLSGGFDPAALYPPKRFFGAARNFEEAGSLTILGTALVDTGSRMDDLVYEEFKGTGNMELHLDRRLADRRIFPAIDIQRSGTRKEELLFDNSTYQSVIVIRHMVDAVSKANGERLDYLVDIIERLKKTKSNKEFLAALKEG
ncbi:transcription termination factor Rho [Microgenomates group bacterium RIFCSPLOWO2_01_FULL_46_13]|nr:MAG: transcription termination factor Rho [Microgenomates group bacterium RIFCSPHIGHO2_01_FULL_45_11]OGV94271.1 MAG: transcription termination factor Rho [Microgenomates group bacterium RIFCSPLOWO2_01_FULL_46_13]